MANKNIDLFLETALIQEWFTGTDNFDSMIDCILNSYSLDKLGCKKEELEEFVRDEIDAFNSDAHEDHKLKW